MRHHLQSAAALIGWTTLGTLAPAVHAGLSEPGAAPSGVVMAGERAAAAGAGVQARREMRLAGVAETVQSIPALMIGALPRLPQDTFGTAVAMPGAMSAGYTTVIAALASGALAQGVRITTSSGESGGVNAATNIWNRDDQPGPGVDALIGPQFVAYSIELSQHLSDRGPCAFQVIEPEEAGFTPEQATWFRRLWAEYQPLVDSADKSAAFQVALWEVAFDSGLDVSTGRFAVDSPSRVGALAQGWLDAVSAEGYEGEAATVMVLYSENNMDMLTAIPMYSESSTSAMGGGGGSFARRSPGFIGHSLGGGGGTSASGGGGGGGGGADTIIPPEIITFDGDDEGGDGEPPIIPAPPVIGVLAIAGLGGSRRRRA